MKRTLKLSILLLPLFSYATTATYYSYDDPRFPQHKDFWSFFEQAPIDVSLIPASMDKYLRDKQLRGGSYVLVKPRFENEIVIFSNGPYYATIWRSGTAIHNETAVLDALLKTPAFKNNFDNLNYKFYRLNIFTPLNTVGGPTKFFVYQMPGFQIKAPGEACTGLLQTIKQIGYTGDAFACANNYFAYTPVYSYKDVKHIGDWIKKSA